MDTEYDFTQTVNNSQQLLDEINSSGLPTPGYINTNGNQISIFYVNPLTTDQQNSLSTVVANHVDTPGYVPTAVQAQINTLIGYLNNSNTSIQATARAIMIQNLAPNLPPAMLTTINSQIAAAVGS